MQGIDFNDNRHAGHCLQETCSGEGGEKNRKKPPQTEMISCDFGRWKPVLYLASKINARAAFWDTFYSMGVPLGVFCIFRRRHFLNALLNVSDQDGKLHAVYTSQKL